MSWCVSHCNAKLMTSASITSVCAAIPLGVALAFTAVTPVRAQFADTPSTSQPSSPPQENTSSVQSREKAQTLTQAELENTLPLFSSEAAGSIAQFTPSPEPSDPNPLPITSS